MWEPTNTIMQGEREYTLHSIQGHRLKSGAEEEAFTLKTPRRFAIVRRQGPTVNHLWFVYTALVDVMAEV